MASFFSGVEKPDGSPVFPAFGWVLARLGLQPRGPWAAFTLAASAATSPRQRSATGMRQGTHRGGALGVEMEPRVSDWWFGPGGPWLGRKEPLAFAEGKCEIIP